jgi:hypothetical protein
MGESKAQVPGPGPAVRKLVVEYVSTIETIVLAKTTEDPLVLSKANIKDTPERTALWDAMGDKIAPGVYFMVDLIRVKNQNQNQLEDQSQPGQPEYSIFQAFRGTFRDGWKPVSEPLLPPEAPAVMSKEQLLEEFGAESVLLESRSVREGPEFLFTQQDLGDPAWIHRTAIQDHTELVNEVNGQIQLTTTFVAKLVSYRYPAEPAWGNWKLLFFKKRVDG